jgi:hypothetical protein
MARAALLALIITINIVAGAAAAAAPLQANGNNDDDGNQAATPPHASPSPPSSPSMLLLLPTLQATAYLQIGRERLLHRAASENGMTTEKQAKLCNATPAWLRRACTSAASAAQSAERAILRGGARWLEALEARLNERLLKALDSSSCPAVMDLARRVVGSGAGAGAQQGELQQQDEDAPTSHDDNSDLAAQLLPGDVIGGMALAKLAALDSNSSSPTFKHYWPLPEAAAGAANNFLGACTATLTGTLPSSSKGEHQPQGEELVSLDGKPAAAAVIEEAVGKAPPAVVEQLLPLRRRMLLTHA